MAPQHIYFGTWVWHTPANDDPFWGPPAVGLPYGCFDLRSVAACASPGLSTGDGIFVYPQLLVNPPAGLTYLGERNANVLTPRKDAIKARLGIGENIVADTVGDVVGELYLQHAEPEWNLRWGRLRGNLTCLGEVWKRYQMGEGEADFPYLLASLRANYQKMKAAVVAGREAPLFHRRYLWYLMEHYRITNYEDITQGSQEPPLPHGTIWTESWPTLGTDISTGQDQVWTEMEGDSEVSSLAGSNRLNNVTTGATVTARCETALAGDAHFIQGTGRFITSVGVVSRIGLMTRFSTDVVAGQDFYLWRYTNGANTGLFRKVVDAVETTLATVVITSPAPDTDYVLKLTSPANDVHVCELAAIPEITHSNGDIQAYVRCGVELRHATTDRATMDDISAEDVASTTDELLAGIGYQTPVRTRPQPTRMIGY